jgi:hypothetical protein
MRTHNTASNTRQVGIGLRPGSPPTMPARWPLRRPVPCRDSRSYGVPRSHSRLYSATPLRWNSQPSMTKRTKRAGAMRGHFWHVIDAVIAAVAVTGFGLDGAKAADIPGASPSPPPPPSYGGPPPDVYAYPPPAVYEYAPRPPLGYGPPAVAVVPYYPRPFYRPWAGGYRAYGPYAGRGYALYGRSWGHYRW